MENKFMNMGENVGSQVAPRDMGSVTTIEACDEIYASSNNPNVNKSACSVLQQTRYIQNFQSLNLPTSAILNIPNTDIVRFIVISASANVTLVAGKALPSGWGYSLIDRLQVVINGSQTYTYDYQVLKNFMLGSFTTRQKRADVLQIGGARTTSSSADAPFDLYLHVPALTKIPDSDCKSIPSDMMLNNNISQVIVYFKDPFQTFTDNTGTPTVSAFTLNRGSFIVVNDTFTDRSLSLGNVLKVDPSASYLAPFQFIQTFSQPLNGLSLASQNTLTLGGFRAGNLNGLLLAVDDRTLYTDGIPSVNAVELYDIVVTFNGVQLSNYPSFIIKLVQAGNNTDLLAVQVDESNIVASRNVNQYIYQIQFSLEDSFKNNSVIMNGLQIGNNQLQLSFRSKRLDVLTSSGSTVFGASAVLKVGYIYTSSLMTSQGGARADYVF